MNKGWVTKDGDLSSWDRVTINEQGRVIYLNLHLNNLTGENSEVLKAVCPVFTAEENGHFVFDIGVSFTKQVAHFLEYMAIRSGLYFCFCQPSLFRQLVRIYPSSRVLRLLCA
ncbi:unnamed protein product [Discosporangium mesarthrocarpum]